MHAVFCSHNANKIREVAQLLPGIDLDMLAPDAYVPPEDGDTFVANARIKAVAGHELYPDTWVIADDSGLCVDALDGAPGIYAARFSGIHGDDVANNTLLLDRMKHVANIKDRTAQFVCVLVAIGPDGTEIVARGEVAGHIQHTLSPVDGFAYDRLFVPDGYTQTFSEMGLDEKANLSHRARACADLLAKLPKGS